MEFIEINGARCRYELAGAGDPTIVLLHEMGGALDHWDGAMPRLTPAHRVLRYDFRGSGRSQKARGELHIDTMVDDLAALLAGLAIEGRVDLVGIAFGGTIALRFATRFPERVRAVVVGSPPVGMPEERRKAALGRAARAESEGLASVAEELMANGYAVELRDEAGRYQSFLKRWLANDPSSYAAIYRMMVMTDIRQDLPRLACPVLVIGGTYDHVTSPAQAQAIAEAIPSARYVELRTAHYMAAATPELVADVARDFLASVRA